jgi:hypothetical protein
MANYACANGHTWSGKSNLSKGFSPSELRCPEMGCSLPAEPKLKQGSGGMGSSAPESRVLADAHTRFSSLVTEWPCFFADRRAGHGCWGPRDPHHLLPASWLKATFGDLSDIDLADILYAPIIGTPLCRKAHEAVEARTEFIYWHELDPELIEFCKRKEEEFPGRPSLLERLKLESPVKEQAA